MTTIVGTRSEHACHRGLRMNADEYLSLGETFERYELIDGVVCMSPSPSLRHQRIITDLAIQIGNHLSSNPTGAVAVEIDVRFSDALVYRPDVIFLTADKTARCPDRVTEVPDVIVEVVSPDSRRFDRETKKEDYERYGVREYWLVDPVLGVFTFYRLAAAKYAEVQPTAEAFHSDVIDGFSLDLERLRQLFA
ncbi:MAG: Uma2 family endonuclease [bacterium]|nr:Uma2 family endonuclease [bacterium]